MAEHTVKVALPRKIEVLSKDLEIQVQIDGELLGTLKISRGSLDWRDAFDQQSHVMNWTKFRNLAIEQGKKRTPSIRSELQ